MAKKKNNSFKNRSELQSEINDLENELELIKRDNEFLTKRKEELEFKFNVYDKMLESLIFRAIDKMDKTKVQVIIGKDKYGSGGVA